MIQNKTLQQCIGRHKTERKELARYQEIQTEKTVCADFLSINRC
jgi:hypothetical protein